jgi:hypothetical protein
MTKKYHNYAKRDNHVEQNYRKTRQMVGVCHVWHNCGSFLSFTPEGCSACVAEVSEPQASGPWSAVSPRRAWRTRRWHDVRAASVEAVEALRGGAEAKEVLLGEWRGAMAMEQRPRRCTMASSKGVQGDGRW